MDRAPASVKNPAKRWFAPFAWLLLSASCNFATNGCSFAPRYTRPSLQVPKAFKEGGDWELAHPGNGELRGAWWTLFQDAELDSLEGGVDKANQDIAVALANFLAARTVVTQAQAQYYPTLSVDPAATAGKEQYAPTQANPKPASYTGAQYSLPFDASWEPDLWGRVRNTVKAGSLEAQATYGDLQDMRLTVHAEVAVDYFQIRALDAQRAMLDAETGAYQETLKLTRAQETAGILAGQDVDQAESQMELAAALATNLGVERALLEHAIATLVGRPASSFSLPVATSAEADAVPVPLGVPSQLLERRPDVAAAELRVAEANARVGIARAAYFPNLTLDGSVGFLVSQVGTVVAAPVFVWSAGALASETIFDGGLDRAVTAQALAEYQGTVAAYRQTVLSAMEQVEDNLASIDIFTVELRQQDAAVRASQDNLDLAKDLYQKGLDAYTDVSAAQIALLGVRNTAVGLRMQKATACVQLIEALGGGWDAPRSKDL